ncbi:MAG: DUF6702 family protein [Nannocystaceae bacterium]
MKHCTRRRRFLRLTGGGTAMTVGMAVWPALAHPFHVTFTEMEHNIARSTLEAAIRVAPGDLEEALGRRVGRRVNLDRDTGADTFVRDYLRQVFLIKTRSGAPVPAIWIGKQVVSHQIAWLYVEFPLPAKAREVWVRNHAFFAIASRQVNTIVFKQGVRKKTLTFSPGVDQDGKWLQITPPKTGGVGSQRQQLAT